MRSSFRHDSSSALPRTPLLVALSILIVVLASGCSDEAEQSLQSFTEEGQEQLDKLASEMGGRESDSSGATGGSSHQVTVARVTDGDTVELDREIMGRTDLRLIGVDTPETYGGAEPLGEAATQFTTDRLEGQQVTVTLGQEPVDPYDRLLGNIRLLGEERMHAELLLERGLAQDLFYSPNTAHEALFGQIQEDARQRQAGIWGLPQAQQCQVEARGNGIGASEPGC